MNTVFIVIEENSPELSREYGSYYLRGVYDTWDKALKVADTWITDNKNYDYFEVEEAHIDDEKQTYCNTIYWNGNDDGDLWVALHIQPAEIQQ